MKYLEKEQGHWARLGNQKGVTYSAREVSYPVSRSPLCLFYVFLMRPLTLATWWTPDD